MDVGDKSGDVDVSPDMEIYVESDDELFGDSPAHEGEQHQHYQSRSASTMLDDIHDTTHCSSRHISKSSEEGLIGVDNGSDLDYESGLVSQTESDGKDGSTEELKDLLEKNRRLRSKLRATHKQLKGMGEELRATHHIFGPGEVVSENDIVRLMEKLNIEIKQLSMGILDICTEGGRTPKGRISRNKIKQKGAMEKIMGIGAVECYLAGDKDTIELFPILGYSLRASMSMICAEWSGITSETRSEYESVAEVHRLALQKHDTKVVGKWRAFAFQTLNTEEHHTKQQTMLKDKLVGSLTYILDFLDAVTTYARKKRIEAVLNLSKREISEVVDLTLRIRKGICEEVTSSFLVPICPTPGTYFDGKVMKTIDDSRNLRSQPPVMCTVGIGLERQCSRGPDFRTEKKVLLKAEVVLEDR